MRPAPTHPALLGYDEAADLVAECAERLGKHRPKPENVSLGQAMGRVLAQSLTADLDQPPFSRSTRDGYACRSAEISTHKKLSITGTTRAGVAPAGPLSPGAAWEIMTGAPMPAGADAVAMLEHVKVEAGKVRLMQPRTLEPGENVVEQGAQGRAGEQLLPEGTVIHAAQIALAAACGCAHLSVLAKPRVAILTTGDELVVVNTKPAPGQIRNSNGPMLAAMVALAGGEPWVLPTAADAAEALDAALAEARQADLILITGGVSAGKFDLVEPALARTGAQFHFTGVRIQPGKPLVFGELPSGKTAQTIPFFGLPGNPVSSAVTFLLFAAPVLAALAGGVERFPRFALAKMAADADRHGKAGLTRFLPAYCDFSAKAGELPEVAFVPWHGSGDLTALARSNCFLMIPEETRNLEPGSIVRILLP
jgi:molybdopterin molybdotransferase